MIFCFVDTAMLREFLLFRSFRNFCATRPRRIMLLYILYHYQVGAKDVPLYPPFILLCGQCHQALGAFENWGGDTEYLRTCTHYHPLKINVEYQIHK